MRKIVLLVASVLFGGLALGATMEAQGGGEVIAQIPFDVIPPGTDLVADGIQLDGEVSVSGGLTAGGKLTSTSGGVEFPDGSVQTTAAAFSGLGGPVAGSLTANQGLYDNRIQNFVPPTAYTEVCFGGGTVLADIHTMGESPVGGNCGPGDLGWIIERGERTAAIWSDARLNCLMSGMRLPEPVEYQFSCNRDDDFGLNDMTDDSEWASNTALVVLRDVSPVSRLAVPVLGGGACNIGGFGNVAQNNGGSDLRSYRCVL